MIRKFRNILCALVAVIVLSEWTVKAGDGVSPSSAVPTAGEEINWQTIGSGATAASGTGFKLYGTVGQTASGRTVTAFYHFNLGFWQNFSASAPPCMCGDADGNSIITISDAVFLITYIFGGGAAPNPICRGDADGNGIITISDAVFLITYIFGGGSAPHCP